MARRPVAFSGTVGHQHRLRVAPVYKVIAVAQADDPPPPPADPFGGIGRNGAQRTPESVSGRLLTWYGPSLAEAARVLPAALAVGPVYIDAGGSRTAGKFGNSQVAGGRSVQVRVRGRPIYVVPRASGEVVIGATMEEHDSTPVVTVGGIAVIASMLLLQLVKEGKTDVEPAEMITEGITSATSAGASPPSLISHSTRPGSTEPARVFITRPSSGVKPMVVSTDRPSRAAHSDAALFFAPLDFPFPFVTRRCPCRSWLPRTAHFRPPWLRRQCPSPTL